MHIKRLLDADDAESLSITTPRPFELPRQPDHRQYFFLLLSAFTYHSRWEMSVVKAWRPKNVVPRSKSWQYGLLIPDSRVIHFTPEGVFQRPFRRSRDSPNGLCRRFPWALNQDENLQASKPDSGKRLYNLMILVKWFIPFHLVLFTEAWMMFYKKQLSPRSVDGWQIYFGGGEIFQLVCV